MLIANGRVVDPSDGTDKKLDLRIRDGRIAARAEYLEPEEGEEVVNAEGLCVMPGLVDMHVHLRDPGLTYKEDILSGCEAAAAGGITSLLCMPNTSPVTDSREIITAIQKKAEQAKAHVYVTAAITQGLNGEALCDFAEYQALGVKAVSDDGKPVKNAAMMAGALCEARKHGLLVTSHCEDLDIIQGGIVNAGRVSGLLGVKGMHRSSEDTVTAREIILAETNGCAVHIAHVSTRLSVQLIREAKARGVQVTAETCPHYFGMTEDEVLKKDADYRMNPPLREEADRRAVLEGVLDGTLDCIVTDHAPHAPEEKADFYRAPNGVIGMETSFAAAYTHLVKPGLLSLSGLLERMSTNPARLLGIEAGTLCVGAAADIAIADLSREWVVDPEKSHSRSKNMIYKGRTLASKVVMTIQDGVVVYSER